MGRITKQQVRVFAMFAAAFYMTGLAYVYSALGDSTVAVASVVSVVVFFFAILQEARGT